MAGGDETIKGKPPGSPPPADPNDPAQAPGNPGDPPATGSDAGTPPSSGVADPGNEGDRFEVVTVVPAAADSGAPAVTSTSGLFKPSDLFNFPDEDSARPIHRTGKIAQNVGIWRDKPALHQYGKTITYGEYDEETDIVANFIANGAGLNKQDMVATFLSRNDMRLFQLDSAAKRAGFTYTNFNYYLPGEKFIDYLTRHPYKILFVDRYSYEKIKPFQEELDRRGVIVVDIDNHHPDILHHRTILDSTPLSNKHKPCQSRPFASDQRHVHLRINGGTEAQFTKGQFNRK